ncbi:DUF7108 domain-containing protein [Halomicrobium salinisoli]|uniref:DUF7108 domain-containing protein n=1 Tax=Halomicrobium salinisoli TaxID=2878391 RepID=UPI001CF08746|nr:rnhA operon protein [Halomicrobium salinisoli]
MTDIPEDAIEEAERLTRLARDAVDEDESEAYREERDELVAEYDYVAREREDDDGTVLVCYPDEWVEGDTVRPERIEDVDRGVERPLSGPGEGDYEAVAERNDEIVAAAAEAGSVHEANVRALADFADNHYAKPIPDLTRAELEEFLDEYFVRNAWPTERQRELVEDSIRLAFEKSETACPLE